MGSPSDFHPPFVQEVERNVSVERNIINERTSRVIEEWPDDARVQRAWAVGVASNRLLVKPTEIVGVAEMILDYINNGTVPPEPEGGSDG